jgi:ribosome-binding protein aMBF1 (putative translation factor)
MQTARLEKGLSQKDVAQKINEKPSILQDYESSKAIPNPQILGKLERVLGVKLRGKLNTPHIPVWLLISPKVRTLGRNWKDRRSRKS